MHAPPPRPAGVPTAHHTAESHAPSVRRAFPPVGTHSTVLQLGQTTTVWLWLNTVVLQNKGDRGGAGGMAGHVVSSRGWLWRQRRRRSSTEAQEAGPTARDPSVLYAAMVINDIMLRADARRCTRRRRRNRCSYRALCAACPSPSGMATLPPAPPTPILHPPSHGEAALALDVHEEGVGGGDKAVELVLPLLQLRRGVEQVDVARQHLQACHGRWTTVSGQPGTAGAKGPHQIGRAMASPACLGGPSRWPRTPRQRAHALRRAARAPGSDAQAATPRPSAMRCHAAAAARNWHPKRLPWTGATWCRPGAPLPSPPPFPCPGPLAPRSPW